jgi:exonuclease VII small subunit
MREAERRALYAALREVAKKLNTSDAALDQALAAIVIGSLALALTNPGALRAALERIEPLIEGEHARLLQQN